MKQEPEDIARMEMPCQCICRNWFDLNDGHGCSICKNLYCSECLENPFDICDNCKF